MNEQRSKNNKQWFAKNGRWFIPLIIIGPMVLISLVMSLIKSSGAYEIAMEVVHDSPIIEGLLGESVKDGFFVSGSIEVNGSSGTADLSASLKGQKDSAKLYIRAVKSEDEWNIISLKMRPKSSGEIVVLIE
ncbi:cytochrome c oxidase assembly factor 1 family protein [Patescibacteria group bacterium]|nr:cytochrome c oxidase assembly factor 1 family protein [Patescibacteria group bacterium]MBU1721771.1 cytochrome c oxidase assembly factor 1 family protein [Patescibacteria group bacterium]MBU1901390.1 cytochrome c oxidase assembly factor 1 family protein [Patescibacteria group bacterium]